MKKEIKNSEENIELHHRTIEEIMGAPPTQIVAAGSGVIFIIVLCIIIGSYFFTIPEVITAPALLQSKAPLEILTAPETGQIINSSLIDEDVIYEGDSIVLIKGDSSDEIIPITASVTGLLEMNPVTRIQEHILQHDTIGFVWDQESHSAICIIPLPISQAKKVQVGNKIRLYVDQPMIDNASAIIESEVKLVNQFNARNTFQVVAIFPYPRELGLTANGTLDIMAEIVINEKTLFDRLISPFRGLKNK